MAGYIDIFRKIIVVVPYTLFLAILILIIGFLGGSVLAVVKNKKLVFLNTIIDLYISYIRGVPIVVHLLIAQAMLPQIVEGFYKLSGKEVLNPDIPAFVIVLVCYSSYQIAIESENLRGIYQSFDKAQLEAGLSIGLTLGQVFRRIVIPQLIPTAIPILLNSFLKIVRTLSVAFLVGVVDIMASARYVAALTSNYVLSFVVAGLIYWFICLSIEGLLRLFSIGLKLSEYR